jgi:sugar phosphate isomerase/epimerase
VIDRRTFLGSMALGGLGALLLTGRAYSGPGSSRSVIHRIGLQLYTVRAEMEQDFEGTLRKVAAIGYKEVEFAGYFKRTPQQVTAVLAAAGLTAPSSHVLLASLRTDLDRTVEAALAIGHKYIVCAYLLPTERGSLDSYKRLGDTFNQAGSRCKAAGLQLAYHNHDFEFSPMEGKLPYDVLLAATDPELVKFEMDLYWITKGRQKPLDYFLRYPGRFPLLHVKDMDNTPRQFFTEVGNGLIDFRPIFAKAQEAGVKHYFVEQDVCPGSPFDSIKTSFEYLRKMNF